MIAEARRRFAAFQADPKALSTANGQQARLDAGTCGRDASAARKCIGVLWGLVEVP
ncbi:hypothetical protein GGR77_002265 [Xanthomonas translucens]